MVATSNNPLPSTRPSRRHRRGVTLIYSTAAMTAVIGLTSFAVDFGRVQEIKTEMQSCADATAMAGINAWVDSGYDINAATAAATAIVMANPIEKNSGVSPTVTMIPGTWDASTRTFNPGSYTSYMPGTPAAKVIISRTAAANNAVNLYFGRVIGMSRADVQATAIATLIDDQAGSINVASTADPYLAGMPAGSSTTQGDTTYNATPYQVTSIPVTPGSWITVSNTAGTTSIVPGTTGYFGADGDAGRLLHHGQNYDGSDYGIGPENGIGDAILPASALYGVFLTGSSPTATPAPTSVVDWTQAAQRDKAFYDSLEVKAPFLIGDGKTSTGTVQRFKVPPGATRLYLGVWDGVAQYNNAGNVTGTITVKHTVRLVK